MLEKVFLWYPYGNDISGDVTAGLWKDLVYSYLGKKLSNKHFIAI